MAADTSLPQLRAFVAVVEAGTLAEAGRRLGMSTASVSKTLARLEQASGVKLLHRSTHAVSLTREGEHLLELARDVLRASDVFVRSAHAQTRASGAGWVRVSASVALMRDVLTPLLVEFAREHPSVRLELRASNELVDLARDGIDLAIRSGPLDRVPGHIRSLWFKVPWVVCAAPRYLEERAPIQRPEDLGGHKLIAFRNPRNGQVRPWAFRKSAGAVTHIAPDANAIYDDGSSGYAAMVLGGGIVCTPLYLAADDLRAGRVVELLRAYRDADTPVSFVRQDGRLTPARVKSLIAFLRKNGPRFSDL